jgi:hypothetical protein
MTTREKELRAEISSECLTNGEGWMSDYLTSCEDKYDFIRCPDSFEYIECYTKDFIGLCNTVEKDNSCEQCWKRFLNGENNE